MRNQVLSAIVLATGISLFAPFCSLAAAQPITLVPTATGFNGLIGIDHHQPTATEAARLVISVNYPFGQPHNFELVEPDGTHTQFSTISGFGEEVKIAAVRAGSCQGGFSAGELFTGTGVPGVIARISPDGGTFQDPWVTLPGEGGLMRVSLFQDRYCAFGGDLIVVTTFGNVWRVTSAGTPTHIASLFTHLEGLTTVPDMVRYGPWAGKILAGAEQQGRIYAIDAAGQAQPFELGINPEDLDIIPANQNFFGVDFAGQMLWGASASQFASRVGDFVIAQESPGILWHVKWNATTRNFEKAEIARVSQWEHVTFSTAGVPPIPPSGECRQQVINDRVTFFVRNQSFDPTPVVRGPAGTLRIQADLTNTSGQSIGGPINAIVTTLTGGNFLLTATEGNGAAGSKQKIASSLAPRSTVRASFSVGLATRTLFRFFVNVEGCVP